MSQSTKIIKCTQDGCTNIADMKIALLHYETQKLKKALNVCSSCKEEIDNRHKTVILRDFN
jgi:hypothetical protein